MMILDARTEVVCWRPLPKVQQHTHRISEIRCQPHRLCCSVAISILCQILVIHSFLFLCWDFSFAMIEICLMLHHLQTTNRISQWEKMCKIHNTSVNYCIVPVKNCVVPVMKKVVLFHFSTNTMQKCMLIFQSWSFKAFLLQTFPKIQTLYWMWIIFFII